MNFVPVGVAGEMYVGGVGVTRGYLKRQELTAATFVPDPFSSTPGARLFRTGDLARWLPSGDIEFLGRRDRQVKIRGFRVELGEIEAVLSRHDAVREVVVTVRDDGQGTEKWLAAYVVPADGAAPSPDELRSYARGKLPPYMVPAAVVVMPRFPLTTNGKVDVRALPGTCFLCCLIFIR